MKQAAANQSPDKGWGRDGRSQPHIVFLFSDTGGGHRSAAQAIIEALDLDFPGQTTHEMVDVFREYAPPPINHAPEIYPPLSRMPSVFGMGFHLSDGSTRTRLLYRMLWPYIRFGLRRLVSEHPADLLVSVHQLINVPVSLSLASLSPKPSFVTVVTDLITTHAAWYSNRADRLIVPTEKAFQRGVKYGVQPERMRIVGLPVADRFCRPFGDQAEPSVRDPGTGDLRRHLGWPTDRPVALLVGGGEGMGPLELSAKAIDAAHLPLAMVIVAGRNQKLRDRLQSHVWQTPTLVYGFVQEMPDFMRAADILITKAGPGTLCEAFIAGLPIILYSRLAGQEEGNVDYVVENGAGVWAPKPERIVSTLERWLTHPDERKRVSQASLSIARPHAAHEIAALLMEQIRISNGRCTLIHTT